MSKFHILFSTSLLQACLWLSNSHPVDIQPEFDRRLFANCEPWFGHQQSPVLHTENEAVLGNLHRSTLPEGTSSRRLQTQARSRQRCSVTGDLKCSERTEVDEERLKRLVTMDKPNSLDLTFHLLREFLQTSRSEKMAQKARNNKKLLQAVGK
uniref:Corticotropin-releasing factor domain-containing protein n=1 Tax=Paramormyrops kingsleyae TaxID=1676925 RepID=A0A3B3RS30_9TELE